MDKAYSTRTHMVVCTLEKETNTSRLKKEVEEMLGPEYLYLNVIDALMYLTNNTRPDIAFLVNYLARHKRLLQCVIEMTLIISYDI
jgi:hypothetical protein